VANCCVELLVMNSCGELLRNQSLTAFIISAINCWSVRCHDTCVLTDRYLVATISHCSGCRGYLAYRTVGSKQWIFPALGNSAFQTTCHNANGSRIHSMLILIMNSASLENYTDMSETYLKFHLPRKLHTEFWVGIGGQFPHLSKNLSQHPASARLDLQQSQPSEQRNVL
jgi:hypothetical protein